MLPKPFPKPCPSRVFFIERGNGDSFITMLAMVCLVGSRNCPKG
jgi:hypothetical protein